MIDPGTIMFSCFLVGLFPIFVSHEPRPSVTKGSTVPVLREADDAEIKRLESWDDAFKEAYDPTNDDTYVEAIDYADAKQPTPKKRMYEPTEFYDTLLGRKTARAKSKAKADYDRKHDLSRWDANLQRFVEKGEEMDAIKAMDGMMHFRHDGCGAQMSKQAWIAEGRPSAKQVIAFFRGESNSPSKMVK